MILTSSYTSFDICDDRYVLKYSLFLARLSSEPPAGSGEAAKLAESPLP